MKKPLYSIILLLVLFGCTRKFDSVNMDPTSLGSVDKSSAGSMFAAAQYNGLILQANNFQLANNLFPDLYCQYLANTSQSFQSDRNIQVANWVNGFWTYFYTQAVPQIQLSGNLVKNDEAAYAITRIWYVFMFHRMTDFFGPIPYSQAGNGMNNVPYDSQQDIYGSFFRILDSAVAVLQKHPGQNRFANNDQIFAGSVDKWLKFANTLKLRLALRISVVDPAAAKTKAEEAVAAGVMTSNADNAMLTTTLNSMNPYPTVTLASWGGPRMSAAMASFLKGYNDPRLPYYFSAIGGKYLSLRNGLSVVQLADPANAISATSNMGPTYLGIANNTQPYALLLASEACFLRAEGALNGWKMNEAAGNLYNQGISLSMSQWNIPGLAITTYITDVLSRPAAPEDHLNSPPVATVGIAFSIDPMIAREQIGTQKWLALYPNGWEAWAELRRTGYPKLYDRVNTDDPSIPLSALIRRISFPQTEIATNGGEVAKAVTLLGDKDLPLTKLWWNK